MSEFLTLHEASKHLGISRRRAQAMVTSGQIPAELIGRQWLVLRSAVLRAAHNLYRHPGRPLSARGAWTRIEALGTEPIPREDLDSLRRRVRTRADHVELFVHPSLLEDLAADRRVVVSGRSAAASAGVPVDDGSSLDLYVRDRDRQMLLDGCAARPSNEGANVHLHSVDDPVWPFDDGERTAALWVAWLDLEDQLDRAAETVLDNLIGGRLHA